MTREEAADLLAVAKHVMPWVEAGAAERERLEKSWWRRFWNLPVPSDEEIWSRLKDQDFDGFASVETWIEAHAWTTKVLAEKLLKAAKHAATVQVSAADLDKIT